MIKSIPTTYNGINFRSRLEATWAAFFDLIGWNWEYEPFDMNGWIPDFLIKGCIKDILVEVKPIDLFCQETALKIRNASNDEYPLLMLGRKLLPFFYDDDEYAIGWMFYKDFEMALNPENEIIKYRGYFKFNGDVKMSEWQMMPIAPRWNKYDDRKIKYDLIEVIFDNPTYLHISLISGNPFYYDPRLNLRDSEEIEKLRIIWADAKNKTQWFPTKVNIF